MSKNDLEKALAGSDKGLMQYLSTLCAQDFRGQLGSLLADQRAKGMLDGQANGRIGVEDDEIPPDIEARITTALEQARMAIDSLKWLTNEYDGSKSAQIGLITIIEQLTAALLVASAIFQPQSRQ